MIKPMAEPRYGVTKDGRKFRIGDPAELFPPHIAKLMRENNERAKSEKDVGDHLRRLRDIAAEHAELDRRLEELRLEEKRQFVEDVERRVAARRNRVIPMTVG